MNPITSYYIVLKDEYTEQDIEATKFVLKNFRQFYVIDERSDFERFRIPTEDAVIALKETLMEENRPAGIPEKIEIKE